MMINVKIAKILSVLLCLFFIVVIIFGKSFDGGGSMSKSKSAEVWLTQLFKKSKLVCFGRYALQIPHDAEVIVGSVSVPDDIEVFPARSFDIARLISEEIKRVKSENDTAEVTYNDVGPIDNSWQIRYFSNKYAKKRLATFFTTFVAKGDVIFKIGDAVSEGESESLAIERQSKLSNSLRSLGASEIPTEPGFCVERGFSANAIYSQQETVAAGINIPILPDVTFSISSNKDAYADLEQSDFQKAKRDELPLLARIKKAKEIQGNDYPFRAVLREGKRTVQHWHGEESLFRREDGTHDFEWAFVGTPKDVANPSEYRVKMFTKVAHNTVGAAEQSSLTDDEAIALWDKLLSGLKFRVKVPGAPEGSYYFLPGENTDKGAKP